MSLPSDHVSLPLHRNKDTDMISLDYLKKILFVNGRPDIAGIDRKDFILEVRVGMGGAVQIIQNKNLPVCIVLEHAERHSLSLHNMGGFHECTQSIWIMEMVAESERAEDVMQRCYERFKRLYSIMVNHCDDKELAGWIENNEVSAYDREAGSYVGYEAMVSFRENEDLSYEPRG